MRCPPLRLILLRPNKPMPRLSNGKSDALGLAFSIIEYLVELRPARSACQLDNEQANRSIRRRMFPLPSQLAEDFGKGRRVGR